MQGEPFPVPANASSVLASVIILEACTDSQVVFDGPGGEADVLKLRLLGEWMHRLRKGRPKKWACEQTEKADVETPPVVLKSPATDKSVSLAEMFYS